MPRPLRRAAAALAFAVLGTALLTGGGAVAASTEDGPSGPSETRQVRVPAGPAEEGTIALDVDVFRPIGDEPAPAVLLAHGFGATKNAVARDAERLRAEGYLVMTYSARGFGRSEGRIHLDSLDHEVADARALVDLLAARDDVAREGDDPVVGVSGASYGGALALMLGATDPRVDAVAAAVTWNDLGAALLPESTIGGDAGGVFKQGWASQLFTGAGSPRNGECGRFSAELCDLYTRLVGGGSPTSADRALLDRSSPASVLSGMTAPTLLLQGRQDSLFGLDQADATARALADAGVPFDLRWFDGGHDAGDGLVAGTADTVDGWLDRYLRGADRGTAPTESEQDGTDPAATFEFAVPGSATDFGETRAAPVYPGLDGTDGSDRELRLRGRDEVVVVPPGGVPAATTVIPGTGSVDAVFGALGVEVPRPPGQRQQTGGFISDELDAPLDLVGAPTVDLRVQGLAPEGETPPAEAVLFAEVRVVQDDTALPVGGGGVAPIRVPLPADGGAVTVPVRLPATTWRFRPEERVLLLVRTTDSLYRGSTDASAFLVDTASDLRLPGVPSVRTSEPADAPSTAAVAGLATVLGLATALAAVGLLVAARRRRRDRRADRAADTAPPLRVRGLVKNYRSGLRAVDDLSFEVQRGQVLGLLGPNGAGKTTTLRMATGLLRADAGEVHLFGHPVTAGAAVLDRVGCFIEGPGFLPHLSGRRNLELYWAATGRPPSEARFEEALAVADLGAAVRRRVGGYSQGMRQRLAIAQAMLGMPELLILDEPTNGLDPPQIHALRGVLRDYAATGRTVIVSSHLLGEVEQTCSHVVVMAHGRLLGEGTVGEVAGERRLEDAFLSMIGTTEGMR